MENTGRPELDNPDVFIAYASEDREKAVAIRDYLVRESQSQLSVFLDEDSLIGVRYRDFLIEQLEKSTLVLVIWSRRFVEKDFTMTEVELAIEQDKYFGVMVEPLSKSELYDAQQYNYFDLIGWQPEDSGRLQNLYDRLLDRLKTKGVKIRQEENNEHKSEDHQEGLESLLACLVNRSDPMETVEAILKKDGFSVLLVDASSKHLVDVFAKNILLKQWNSQYAVLEKLQFQGIMDRACCFFTLNSSDSDVFQTQLAQLLSSQKRVSGEDEDDVISNWIDSGSEEVKVVYAVLDGKAQHQNIQKITTVAKKFLENLEFDSSRKLVVLFHCNREKYPQEPRKKGFLSQLFGSKNEVESAACVELKLDMVDKDDDINSWFSKCGQLIPQNYSRTRLDDFLDKDERLQGESNFYYKKLYKPLQDALKYAKK